MSDTIEIRQAKDKELLLEQLKKIPIVQIAVEKSGVSRATYYRWRKEDPAFAQAADQALIDGSLLVNDMAESQLLTAIRERNMPGIQFWLKHHHPVYATKIEVMAHINQVTETLTPEQEAVVAQALRLASGSDKATHHEKHPDQSPADNPERS